MEEKDWEVIRYSTRYDGEEEGTIYGFMVLKNEEGRIKVSGFYDENRDSYESDHIVEAMYDYNKNREDEEAVDHLNSYLVNVTYFDSIEELLKNLSNLEICNKVYIGNILCFAGVEYICEKLNHELTCHPINNKN